MTTVENDTATEMPQVSSQAASPRKTKASLNRDILETDLESPSICGASMAAAGTRGKTSDQQGVVSSQARRNSSVELGSSRRRGPEAKFASFSSQHDLGSDDGTCSLFLITVPHLTSHLPLAITAAAR